MKVKTMLIVTLLALVALGIASTGCAGPVAAFDGERLGPCPDSPNCVCSEMSDESSAFVEPFAIPASVAPEDAFEALAAVVGESARIERRDPTYLHAVYTTRLMRFRDDLEARLDPEAGVIHVRSASRLGHSDLGANRKRVEKLRAAFADALQ